MSAVATTGELNEVFFEQKLKEDKASLEARIAKYESEMKVGRESTSVDDIATEYESRAKAKGLKELDEARLRQTKAALARLERGEYGECQTCFDEINPKRLETNPSARNCIDCESSLDKKNKHYR